MNYILFDDKLSEHLLPFTFTRPAADILVGIWTITEKWEFQLGRSVSYLPYRTYLETKFQAVTSHDNVFINGRVLPDATLTEAVKQLGIGEALIHESVVLAVRSKEMRLQFESGALQLLGYQLRVYEDVVRAIQYPYDIFSMNGEEIKRDFLAITGGRKSLLPDESNKVVNVQDIFLEEGAVLTNCILNASAGPIYIARDAEVMDGAIIRGPFALGEHSTVKMGAKIYGDTSIGPHCKVGGEISNSVILGYSNKGHDGFMGNSVIGHWCNWGADTNNSNLKNNYETVKLWDYPSGRFRLTGLQFCGLMMGDHSKCGINTMFNTGTVIGVGANIFGAGFPRNFLPSFTWGGAQGFETFKLPKFYQTAEKVMERRGIALDEAEKQILSAVYMETAVYRNWENLQT